MILNTKTENFNSDFGAVVPPEEITRKLSSTDNLFGTPNTTDISSIEGCSFWNGIEPGKRVDQLKNVNVEDDKMDSESDSVSTSEGDNELPKRNISDSDFSYEETSSDSNSEDSSKSKKKK